MSIGINDMQSAWQNFGLSNGGGGGSSSAGSALMGTGQFASLQTPSSVNNTASASSGSAAVPGINQVQLPSWLSSNPDASMKELTDTYAGIGAAFDPTAQVNARNNQIAYQTSQGGQTANNAATEYSNRAAQAGGSGLGAGAVKAQAMMPVMSANAQLRTDAADVAAKAHQDAISLASQVAGTIGNLRQSYLSTLTSYATGQQQLALSKYQAQQQAAGQAANTALGYAQTRADVYKSSLAATQSSNDSARLAATSLLGAPGPSGNYTTDNNGNVISGQSSYTALKNWQGAKSSAQSALLGMI